jgi:PAS domain S-box-containing protein
MGANSKTLRLFRMKTSEQAPARENNPSPPTGEGELRILNKQLQEQADQLRALNQELLDREQRLRLSIETGRVGVWVWDATGSIHTLDWSRRLKEIFGLSADAEVTRELFLECVHSEDRERVDWAIMQSLSGVNNGFYNIEYRIVHPGDNSVHWVTAQGQAFFDVSGQSIRFIGAVVDISDRKQVEEFTARLNLELEHRIANRTKDLEQINHSLSTEVQERIDLEQRLRQSERHLKVAQHLSLTGSFSWFASTGKIVWSEETYRIYSYDTSIEPAMELARKRIHPDDLHIFDERAKNAPGERKDFSFHHRLLMPDGKVKHVKIITRNIADLGQSVFVGAIMDVTEQKKAEEALRASEHVARGQAEALKEILNSISTELDPDKFLQHVLYMIAKQMGGQSVTVWNRDDDDSLSLGVTFEENQLHVPTRKTTYSTQDQPMWAEAFRTGTDCILTEFTKPIRMRLINRPDSEWVPRINDMTPPSVRAENERLAALGVSTNLAIPMLRSGRVAGFIGIGFTKKREFQPEEIDLSRALAHQAMLAMQLMRLSRKSQQAAVTAERNRMARDIHDTLAQGFTGVIAQLQAAKGATRLADASAHIERAENLARSSLGEARRSVRALRPRSLREATLSMALENMLSAVAHDSGLKADFVIQGEQRPIPPDWEEGLLRVAQESLTNTIRHAQAQNFRVRLSFEIQQIQLKLVDDGRGFNPGAEHEGFGLIGMKERVDWMGGEFVIHSQPEHGTETVITLQCPTVLEPTHE